MTRWKARRGFVPSETTVKYGIFKPETLVIKPSGEDDVVNSAQRAAMLEKLALLKESFRRKYRTDLFGFCQDVLGYDKMDREVHGELCDRLMAAYWGRAEAKVDENSIARFLFLLPRGTFKTTIATIGFPQWILLQNDPVSLDMRGPFWSPPTSFNGKLGCNQRVLIGSEVEEHAAKFHENIKAHFQGTEAIREFFGSLAPDKRVEGIWTRKQSNITWRTDFRSKEANLTITSLDATVNSGHYDIGIFDDMISEKQITNDEQITQVIEWYRRLMPLMEKPSIVIFIGTRWHDKDLYGYFLDEEAKKWTVYKEAAERTEEEILAGKRKYFFPSLLGPGVLEDLRTTMRPYLFSCQYFNDPIAATDALFKAEYFKDAYFTLPAGDHLQRFLADKCILTTVDPASGKEKDGCFRVVTTWAWDYKGVGWCLDMYRERESNPNEWMREAFRQYTQWRPSQVGLEQYELYRFVAETISRETGLWLPWIELKPNQRKKELRIAALEPLARSGRLKLQKHMTAFEEEALRFPRGAYKDALDATAYQLDLAFMGNQPTPDAPEAGSEAWTDAMMVEERKNRLARLKIGDYDARVAEDWYNM